MLAVIEKKYNKIRNKVLEYFTEYISYQVFLSKKSSTKQGTNYTIFYHVSNGKTTGQKMLLFFFIYR